ncbi:MAG: FtsH protease activity modulator HflK [Gammaproteobacteria bacterium]|nr:FtsH protease activity modulator HflK [Gammaproteobacteria bacterium]
MAWNEPGGNDKDPWSGKGGDQGPPDLDEVVKKMQEKFGGLFGGKRGGGGGGSSGGSSGSDNTKAIIALVLVAVVAVSLYKSFYTVAPAERGVILRFGAYADVSQPGPHFLIPYVDNVVKVNVDQISSFPHKAQMLTRDENIVDIELTIQYRIQDAADYLFQDSNPEKTIRDATETAVRETVGQSDLDFIMTEGRSSIADRIKERVQQTLNDYSTGIEVTSVNTQPAKPPEQVKSAFDDAIKAREDKAQQENKAEAYANEVIPKARGAAARRVEAAKAYKEQVIAESEGETSRFLAVLSEYRKAPEVTRQRLYIETTEAVLSSTSKVILDAKSGNSLMYLPLDKLISRPAKAVDLPSVSDMDRIQIQRDAEKEVQDLSRGRRTR